MKKKSKFDRSWELASDGFKSIVDIVVVIFFNF